MKVWKSFQRKNPAVYDEIEKFIIKKKMYVSNCKEFINIINEKKKIVFYFYSIDDINHYYFKFH